MFVALAGASVITTAFAGCGGSVSSTGTTGVPDARDGGAPAGGQSSSRDASTASGGTSSGAGGTRRTGGVTGPGGAGGSGGANCADVQCDLIACAAGFKLVTLPNQCCLTCVPDCSTVDCVDPLCQLPEQLLQMPSECCGHCGLPGDGGVPGCNPTAALTVKKIPLAVGGLSCKTDADCTIVSLDNRCWGPDCGTAINASAASKVMAAVNDFANANCRGCPITDVACPPVVYTAVCQQGQCTRTP